MLLPPVEKIPLKGRKSFRDDFENKKESVEAEYSKLLGQSWTLIVDPLQVYPYADAIGEASNFGSICYAYFSYNTYQIESLISELGQYAKEELNKAASSHEIRLEATDDEKYDPVECDIHDGALRILFHESKFGQDMGHGLVHVANALERDSEATEERGSMSFWARASIAKEWDPKVANVRKKIADYLRMPNLKIEPDFESNYPLLCKYMQDYYEDNEKLQIEWKKEFGKRALRHLDGIAGGIKEVKFHKDEMILEGIAESIDKSTIRFKIVPQLHNKSSHYFEPLVRDGEILIQFTPEGWEQYCMTSEIKNLVDEL